MMLLELVLMVMLPLVLPVLIMEPLEMKVPLILPNMMSPCQAMMTLQLILWLDMLMVMVLELLAVILQIKLPMRPDNAVTANPQLSDLLLVATLCAATPSSALVESWTVASLSALEAMEPVCMPHV